MDNMPDIALRYLVLLAALQQLVFPFFVNPFSSGENPLRANVPSQLEPAGYAFAIWGPIYLLAVAYGVWQLTSDSDGTTASKVAPFALVLYLGSSVWLYLAKYGPLVATIPVLAVMAICATICLLFVLRHENNAGAVPWAAVLPFALYAGWTLCATFVNFAEVAPAYGFNRFGLSVAGFALLSIAAASALAASLVWYTQANIAFAATIAWAFAAIAVAGIQRQADGSVVAASLLACGFILALVVYIRLAAKP